MKQVDIHEAKTHLSALIDQAANGESFVIAKAGKPHVIVCAYEPPHPSTMRTGFMSEISIPDNFDTLMADEIAARFMSFH